MAKPSEKLGDDAPLYIRWSPDRSPYAIELRLDLVAKIMGELAQAERLGVEIGGVLVGSVPDAHMPTLRVEDVEITPRDAADRAMYLSGPEQQARFFEIRWSLRRESRAALGLFRSHLRPGPLRPSPADRSLLSEEFNQAVYAALLIQGRAPYSAAFFVAHNGELPNEPAVREFRFNEGEFRALPEVQPETLPAEQESEAPKRHKGRLYALVATLLLIGLAACLLMWSFTGQAARPSWLRSSHQLQLAVTGNGRLLRISWNHSARDFDGSPGATLVITDGASRREVKLGSDELRLGSVEYDRSSPHVQVTMTIDRPGKGSENQSAEWNRH